MIKSILIDATHFGTAQPTGVENYTDNLLPRLSTLLLEKGVEVSWVGHSDKAPVTQGGLQVPEGVKWLHSKHRPAWSQLALALLIARRKPDLFFSPSGLTPLLSLRKSALTVHDLSAYLFQDAYAPGQLIRLRLMGRLAANKASLILTPSQYTAGMMSKIWSVPIAKLKVTPLAYEKNQAATEAVPGVEIDPTFLFMGRLESKKNLLALLEGFAKLATEKASQLVLAGSAGLGYAEIRKYIASLPEAIQKRIILPGYVSEAQKNWLYDRALAVVVPGFGEGFGLPVLEAFAYKVPTICAQAGALVEVGGEAVLYSQADIPTDWYLHMRSILEDPHLRSRLVEKGSQRLDEYSWKNTAELSADAILSL